MVNIRRGEKDEVRKLQELNVKAFVDNPKYDSDYNVDWSLSEDSYKYFTKVLNDSDSLCLVAEENGQLVGYLSGSTKAAPYWMSKYFEIDNVGVVPEKRHQGVGSRLMEECYKWAKENGFQKVYVNSYFSNTTALDFYKKNGFVEVDISLEKNL